jgi:hypothetical protein
MNGRERPPKRAASSIFPGRIVVASLKVDVAVYTSAVTLFLKHNEHSAFLSQGNPTTTA